MKHYFSVIFLILGLIFLANAQKLVYGGKPKVAPKVSGVESFYITFPKGIGVYKVQNDTDEDRQIYFEFKKDTKTLGKIDASLNASGGELSNFHALLGDLDKNKSAELIVVDFNGQSNGLGVNYYTINIFPDFETKGFTKPLTFNTSEFGKDGTFIYNAKKNETLILQTEWGGVNIKDAKRGGGLYFTGRFFRFRNGRLKPAGDKPILARRYLNSFEKERFRTDKDSRRPYLWLTSPSAIKLTADPVFSVKPVSTQSGIIEKFEDITEQYKNNNNETRNVNIQQITVRLDSGEIKTFVITKSEDYTDLPSDKNKIFPETFGVLPTKMIFPSDFSPLLVFDKLEGKRVQLNAYQEDKETPPTYKLWFIEK